MPCTDVTEILSLTIDHQDCIIHYSLAKLTCGAAVGNPSLLRKWIDRRPAVDVLSATLEDVLTVLPTRSQTWEFLTLKHLTAVQHGLRAMLGFSRSGPDDVCAVQTIETDERGITLLALMRIDLITTEIAACGNCCRGDK
ncbi:hypothetical protein C3F09_01375 [candidate division GN15 bacterium]|uniref:NIF system FeS cluster assembly NifU N-terminal domain-containing protein n=1 Tax=candidate division GN15 bacterium TaxID=2072418 RepID=A0A855X439_9BACT|nr:MAG: hypothetical protein C3F09_01375 [candidate division GN15 bacterium]